MIRSVVQQVYGLMDHVSSRPVTARVVATASLLRGGLARVARAAGLIIVSSDAEPAITLRGVEQRPVGTTVDVAVGEHFVTITVQGVPEVDTWLGVLSLLREFNETAEHETGAIPNDITDRALRQP